MNLVHVKLKSGEDLIGHLESTTDLDIELISPIAIEIDPQLGFFAKSWLLLSETNTVRIRINDLLFYNSASEKAHRYYDEFLHRFGEADDAAHPSEVSDLEDMFVAMMESKASTKH